MDNETSSPYWKKLLNCLKKHSSVGLLVKPLESFPVGELPELSLRETTDRLRASAKTGIPNHPTGTSSSLSLTQQFKFPQQQNPQTPWALLAGSKERQGGSSSSWPCLQALELPVVCAVPAVPAANST